MPSLDYLKLREFLLNNFHDGQWDMVLSTNSPETKKIVRYIFHFSSGVIVGSHGRYHLKFGETSNKPF